VPLQKAPLFSLRATGLLGGHRRGALAPTRLVRTVHPVADAAIFGAPLDLQDDNYGFGTDASEVITYLGPDKSSWTRTITRYDLRSFIGNTFSAATLSLHKFNIMPTPGTIRILRCTRPEDWLESQVTWLSFATGSPWSSPGGDYDSLGPPGPLDAPNPSSSGYHHITGLLPFVEDALANRSGWLSFIIKLNAENPPDATGTSWLTRETPSSLGPYLTLFP